MTKESGARRGPGKPPSENGLNIKRGDDGSIVRVQKAQSQNYVDLTREVSERIEHARANGKKLYIRDAVRTCVLHAIKLNNETPVDRRPDSWKIVRDGRAEERINTAYIEVRKLLAEQRRNQSKPGNTDALSEAGTVSGSFDALMEAHRRWDQ